jgi:tetratricopeptide (TPR) repeat protein
MLNYAESAILSKIGEPATFFYLSGLAAYKLGDHQKAMYYFEKCITIDPENVYALRLLKLAKQNGSNSLNLDDIAGIAQFQVQGFYPLMF